MLRVDDQLLQGLERRMPLESTADHPLKPFPFTLCAHCRVDAYKTAACLHKMHEGQFLRVRIKYIVIGVGKYEGVVFAEIGICKICRGIRYIHLKAVFSP